MAAGLKSEYNNELTTNFVWKFIERLHNRDIPDAVKDSDIAALHLSKIGRTADSTTDAVLKLMTHWYADANDKYSLAEVLVAFATLRRLGSTELVCERLLEYRKPASFPDLVQMCVEASMHISVPLS